MFACLFIMLSSGTYMPRGRSPGPSWITVALVWVMAGAALLYGLSLLAFIILALLGKLPGATSQVRRVRADHLLLFLLYGLIAAWGIIFLVWHWGRDDMHTLATTGCGVYSLWFWNASRRFRERHLSGG